MNSTIGRFRIAKSSYEK